MLPVTLSPFSSLLYIDTWSFPSSPRINHVIHALLDQIHTSCLIAFHLNFLFPGTLVQSTCLVEGNPLPLINQLIFLSVLIPYTRFHCLPIPGFLICMQSYKTSFYFQSGCSHKEELATGNFV